MRLFHSVVLVLVLVSARNVVAQSESALAPQGLETLRQSASSKTEFTLDHSMLVLASKLDPDNEDLRRVIAGVNGVSVHSYHFPGAWNYDPEALSSVRDEYRDLGWKHMVNKHDKNGTEGENDLWIRWQNNAVSDIAILLARSNQVNLIVVSGSISP